MREGLNFIFSPKSIAVIGASTREGSVGRAVFANILFSGYTGIVYPVNPKARGILGVRAYHSVWDIPGEVDLGVIVVPSEVVPQVMEECGEKNIKGTIIISAGFKEIGKKGKELEEEVKKIAQKYKIRIVGPNCLGIINTEKTSSLNTTFVTTNLPKKGKIAFISQSGALGVAALEYVKAEGIGLSKFISMGNKADINENDLLKFLKNDPSTDVILLYVEDLTQPNLFIKLAREITGGEVSQKPIIAIKSGRTTEGRKAASSHTGALAGSDEVYDSLFRQCGVLRVETLEELFNCALGFANQPLPKGNKIAIVTNAGGPGIMATDASIRYGLKLAKLGEKATQKLKTNLPKTANIENPIDIIGDAKEDRYEVALKSVLEDGNVDGVIVICTPREKKDVEKLASLIIKITPQYKKPIVSCFMGVTDISQALKMLEEGGIPHYKFPEACAKVISNMVNYSQWLKRPRTEIKVFKNINRKKVKKIIEKCKKEKRKILLEPEAYEVLKAYNFPVVEGYLAKSEKKAKEYAQKIGYPVVLKIVSPDILHKTEIGGVKLEIKEEKELIKGYKEIIENVKTTSPYARISGVLVQKMLKRGKETIIGINRDPLFGGLIMFGLGGVYVEILKDVTFRIIPIRELSAQHMIEDIKGYKILKGYRGEEESDIEAIVECLERLSQLGSEVEEIKELDINPLIVFKKGEGVKVADVKILIN
jgi:acetyl coenzyme A synthetase (ADP forming)-like protein